MAVTVLAELSPSALFTLDPDAAPAPESASGPVVSDLDPQGTDVSVFDLGLVRGDGIFEATEVTHGVALALRLHVRRLARSARLVGLPPVLEDAWVSALEEVVSRYDSPEPGLLKVLVSRGADPTTTPGRSQDPGVPHVWVFIDQKVPKDPEPNGIAVITLDREIRRDSVTRAPWLLLGAKTLSYAMNMATDREVARRGAGNAIFLTTDGYVLEGPRSNVILRTGETLVTPHPRIGILHGTTQQEFFAFAASQGLAVEYRDVTVDQLRNADQIWMGGGSTLHAVTTLDGAPVSTDIAFTRAANEYMRTQRPAIDAYTLTAPSPLD